MKEYELGSQGSEWVDHGRIHGHCKALITNSQQKIYLAITKDYIIRNKKLH